MDVIIKPGPGERIPPGLAGAMVAWLAKEVGRSDLPPDKRPKTAIEDIVVLEAP